MIDMSRRHPLSDPTAELDILAHALSADGGDLHPELVEVRASDYYDERHRILWAAISAAIATSRARPTIPSVVAELQAAGTVEQAGGGIETAVIPYLLHLQREGGCTVWRLREAARRLRRLSRLRHAVREFDSVVIEAMSGRVDDVDEFLAAAGHRVSQALADATDETDTRPIGQWAHLAAEDAHARLQRGTEIGIPSGLPTYDRVYGGLHRGETIVIGGRSGKGKSSLGWQMAEAMSATGPVVYYSLEMRGVALAKRAVAPRIPADVGVIASGRVTAQQVQRMAEVSAEMQDLRLIVCERRGMTVEQIRLHALGSAMREGRLSGIVVDYLQRVRPSGGQNREQQVAHVSSALCDLAQELDCPVIVAAQLNRQAAADRPEVWHLRESGSIEQDADVIILPHWVRPEGGHPDDDVDGVLIIGKARMGGPMDIPITWRGTQTRYVERSR